MENNQIPNRFQRHALHFYTFLLKNVFVNMPERFALVENNRKDLALTAFY